MAVTPVSQNTDFYSGGMIRPSDVPAIQPEQEQFGQIGQPAFVMDRADGTRVTAGEMVADPMTGLAEPQYDDMPPAPTASSVAAGAPPISDPIELAQWHSQQEMSALSRYDQQLAAIQAPIQSRLDISKQQYGVDFDTIANSNMPLDQKERQLQDLNARYQKKWIGIKGEIQLEEQEIQQQKQQATFQLQLQQTLRMQQIQQYAQMARDGYIDGPTALRLQYKVLGYEVPATFGQPTKVQNPIEQIKDLRVVIDNADEVLHRFQYNDKTGEMRFVKPKDMWAGDKFNSKKDTRPATPSERQLYAQTRQEKRRAQDMQDQLRQQRLNIVAPNIMVGTDPLSRSIKSAKPRQSAYDPNDVSDLLQPSANRDPLGLGL